MAGPSEVCEMPRNTYSVASAALAEKVHARCSGAAGGVAILPRDGVPSARAEAASRAAPASAAAPRQADFTSCQFIVASPVESFVFHNVRVWKFLCATANRVRCTAAGKARAGEATHLCVSTTVE